MSFPRRVFHKNMVQTFLISYTNGFLRNKQENVRNDRNILHSRHSKTYKCLLIITLILCAIQLLPRIGCETTMETTTKVLAKRSIDTTEKVPRLGEYM